MRIATILGFALAGCSQSQAALLEPVRETALSCVERQAPDGTSVSASRAQAVVSNCKAEFEAWSRVLVEGAFEQPFDAANPKMVDAYNRVLNDNIDLMQLRISDGPHRNLPAI